MKTTQRVLIVGDVMLDRYFFGTVDRISPEAPVPIVRITRIEERPGGAANVARNIAEINGGCSLLGVVGDDEAGKSLEALLTKDGVNVKFFRDTSITTTVKLRVLAKSQQMIRLDFEQNPSAKWISFRAETFDNLLHSHEIIVISDYAKGALTDCENLIAKTCQLGAKIIVDPKGNEFSRYHGAYLLSPNVKEFRAVVGHWKDESHFTALAEKCREDHELQALLVTRSEAGMTLFDSEGRLHIPSEAREVFDVSGAGDTVVATIASMMTAGKSLRESVTIANRAAGIVVGKLGTAKVSREELFGA